MMVDVGASPGHTNGNGSSQAAVTAKDVARLAGVHPSTVSRSLDPVQLSRISSATRARVVAAAETLGYLPHFAASSLRRQRSMSIGVITPSYGNPIYGELLHGISVELEQQGYVGLIVESPDESRALPTVLARLRARQVDGIICASGRRADASALRELRTAGVPLVQVLRWVDEIGAPVVECDDELGAALAARHLQETGHQMVLELPGPPDNINFRRRSQGFAATLAGSRRTHLRKHDVVAEAPSTEEGKRMMRSLIDAGALEGVSAVFAHNDLLAIGAIDAIEEAGLHCPRDVSVIGYNDNPLTDHLSPALTTIRLPSAEMGRLAARRMLQEISGDSDLPSEISLPPELVVRASTRARPS
ncbi:LacI family DNA-binding transcriptional regulator [Cryobacterium sp. BB736]|uniref:LacI family DNA-binding transcriptional regulator n=1 Tax=Cryobacterium sp. BB736 TaxID=2746963 RepID=UPI001873E693|nr:LacI family DNA-binding transcriptional regulator [Cryobacterium sp. BB736]